MNSFTSIFYEHAHIEFCVNILIVAVVADGWQLLHA